MCGGFIKADVNDITFVMLPLCHEPIYFDLIMYNLFCRNRWVRSQEENNTMRYVCRDTVCVCAICVRWFSQKTKLTQYQPLDIPSLPTERMASLPPWGRGTTAQTIRSEACRGRGSYQTLLSVAGVVGSKATSHRAHYMLLFCHIYMFCYFCIYVVYLYTNR